MKTAIHTTALTLVTIGLATAVQASTVGEKSLTTSKAAFEVVARQAAVPVLAPTDKHSAASAASPASEVRSHTRNLAIVHPGEKTHGLTGRRPDSAQLADTAAR